MNRSLLCMGLVLLGVTGCTHLDRAPDASSHDTIGDPITFDEAVQAYNDYLAAENLDRTTRGDRSAAFLTDRALDEHTSAREAFASAGLHIVGESTADFIDGQPLGEVEYSLSVCLDSSETEILTSAGDEVTPTRDPRTAIQVRLVRSRGAILIAETAVKDFEC